MKSTIKDVANLAGVSFKTVSRVINKESSVKPETVEKVNKAIEQLRYQPNTSARNLAGTSAYALAYVYDNPNAYYVISMQNGILNECRERGYELIIHPCNSSDANVLEEIIAMIKKSQLAGIVLSPPLSEMQSVLDGLDELNVNYVRIISGSKAGDEKKPCVFVNDRAAAQNITRHLIQQGHRRIGFICGDKGHKSTDERLLGYKNALAEEGLEFDNALVVDGTYSFEAGVNGFKTLSALDNKPTAIFGCNDEIASGALFAARLNEVDVPRELAIAGFENSPFSRQTWPKLTTAAQPNDMIAKTAASTLIDFIKKKKSEPSAAINHQIFEPELVVRESTQHS
ncbi:LacI family DNA-binding transcriptional regulator [Alteromonas sediminis]|uniref:LacI family DNA-binding transcriptional regulator n=1 Tax=Alteromonas sediminis TaxID=2259342 RepID=A0A3N5Y6D8_9ALTE|nr:LacI family DNA-binding transcriptional regulator [Alteromonas sediminis]RPJ65999.1 LacI family DNA-binding transcriptional regulator [Alteromonas sediminis]